MELGKNLIVLLVALAAAILVFVLLPSTDFVPYHQGKLSYGSYEPFVESVGSGSGSVSKSDEDEQEPDDSPLPMVGGAPNVLTPSASMSDPLPLESGVKEGYEEYDESAQIKRNPDFAAAQIKRNPVFAAAEEHPRDLQWGTLNREIGVLDKFSQVNKNGQDGVDGCVSAGLSNTGGYICLTPDLIKLLATRGGNATGQDSQIGAPPSSQ